MERDPVKIRSTYKARCGKNRVLSSNQTRKKLCCFYLIVSFLVRAPRLSRESTAISFFKKPFNHNLSKDSRAGIIQMAAGGKVMVALHHVFQIVNFGIDFIGFFKIIHSFHIGTHWRHYGN